VTNKGGIMKHTEGKMNQGPYYKSDLHIGAEICECKPLDTIVAIANAERIAALWNAADGMSNDEAVKALKNYKKGGSLKRAWNLGSENLKLNKEEINK
jgi:hypothetical protein